MHLSKTEVERFYRIWFPLLHYVNQQQKLLSKFPSQWGNADVAPEDAVLLRDALWANDGLREAFIAENPANLSAADLALVDSWNYRVADSFFIFRYLKKYTIFISSGSPARAYGVLGLLSSIEEIVGPYLPIYVKRCCCHLKIASFILQFDIVLGLEYSRRNSFDILTD